jgi:hypothetical protein
MSVTGMLAAVAKAAAMETDETDKEDMQDCSCNPDDPNYSPDCDCGDTAEKPEEEEDKVAKAVKAERSRILSIAAAAFPGQDKLCAKLIESGASVGDAALAFNADHKAKGAKIMASLDADEASVKGLRSEPANGSEPQKSPLAGLSGEALWKAEFQGSAELRAEFGSETSYLAFKRAEANGRVRILNKKSA